MKWRTLSQSSSRKAAANPRRRTGITRWAAISALLAIGLFSYYFKFVQVVHADGPTAFSGGAISIPAVGHGSPYPSTIAVAGLNGTISEISVQITNLTHGEPGGVNLLLVAPGGTRKLLILSHAGNQTSSVSGSNFTLTDLAPGYMPNPNGTVAAFPTSGTYKPTFSSFNPAPDFGAGSPCTPSCPAGQLAGPSGSGTLASNFSGANPNGTWSLYVLDDENDGLGGSIGGWSITITTNAAATATTTTLSSNINPSFTSAQNSSVTLTSTTAGVGTTGVVAFTDGGVTISGCGARPVSGGQATCTTTFVTEGTHDIVASYSDSTAAFGSSTSSTFSQVVSNHTIQSGSGNTLTFANSGLLTIPQSPATGANSGSPSNPYPSNIFVGNDGGFGCLNGGVQCTNMSGSISNVAVTLTGFHHANADDVDMLLVAPDGSHALVIWSDVGGNSASGTVNITLNDSAGSLLPDNGPLVSGSFRPTNIFAGAPDPQFPSPAPSTVHSAAPTGSTTLQNEFGGLNPNGTWKLYVVDDVSGLTGAIDSGWSLTITTNNDAPTTTSVTSTANPSFTGSSVTFTATVRDANTSGLVTAGGNVTFTDENGNILATVAVATSGPGTGTAAFSKSDFSEGSHVVTASYSGVPGSTAPSFGTITQQVDNQTVATVNAGVYTFCNPNTGHVTIPNALTLTGPATPYPSHIFVSGLPGTVNHVTVSINGFSHTAPADVQSLLVGQAGTMADGLDFFSHAGNTTAASNVNLTFADSAPSGISSLSAITSGTFKPTSATNANTWPAPAPVGTVNFAAPAGVSTLNSVFGNTTPNGTWSLYFADTSPGNSGSINGSLCLNFTQNAPALAITKTHSGNFGQGQTGATYTVHVTNNGPGPTAGTVTVTDNAPSGLTVSNMTGTNWSCAGTTCTRSDALNAGSSYEDITVTVSVANNATTPLVNQASVSGGGTTSTVTANDSTIIVPTPDLTLSKSHSGNFTQGLTGNYTLTVTNIGNASTSGTTTVVDTLPSGWTLNTFSGTGWSCSGTSTVTCTSSQVVANGSAFNALTLTVNVPGNSALSVTNNATVSGGGEFNTGNNSASDPTTVNVGTQFRVNDASVVKSSTSAKNLLFTVTLAQPAAANNITVHYATSDGTAAAGTDYTSTSGDLTFNTGDQFQTVAVPVAASSSAGDKTLTMTLSSPSLGVLSRASATGTIKATATPSIALISELRTSGPGGPGDDFVEIYNNSNAQLTVAASDASAGWGVVKGASGCGIPQLIGTIPFGTVIPARGHYLLVGSQYSLGGYPNGTPDLTLTSDIESDVNIGLFSTADLASLSSANRLDAVGFGSNIGGNCDLLREGTNLGAALGSTAQYSFVRKLTTGFSQDTDDNASDFFMVSTDPFSPVGSFATPMLGAPGPENRTGPRPFSQLQSGIIDPSQIATASPNRVRDTSPYHDGLSNTGPGPGAGTDYANGTLAIRRSYINRSGGPVNRLRFRLIDVTSYPTPNGGTADLRAITAIASKAVTITGGSSVIVRGLALENSPPNLVQPFGGGTNATVTLDLSGLPGGVLPDNGSVNVEFLLGVKQLGGFRFFVLIEGVQGP
jgi:uncharacterized repeat protein (TIGR01451 family)